MTLSALSLLAVLTAAQEDYALQMEAYRERIEPSSDQITAEVSIELHRNWKHARLFTADFVTRSAGAERPLVAELIADPFELDVPATFVHEGSKIHVLDKFDWGGVRVDVRADLRETDIFDEYLARWHWDWEAQDLPGGRSTGVIHAVSAHETGIRIDFGSAPPDAFLDLITTLASAGFDSVDIRSDRTSD
ncbi:MAG: hypothetical protein AAFV19_04610 [Pseudomonadota bacterium]